MNKKLIFRILGALSSALIIVSVFVPFVYNGGYTQSLWNEYNVLNQLYLPIILIVLGAFGVLFLSLNVKPELAYITSGGGLFFAVTQAFSFINQKQFNSLNVGYYFLLIGSVLTAIMSFLISMKKVKVKEENVTEPASNNSMLEQIDRLYNNENQTVEPIQQINNIQPISPIQPIEPIPLNPDIQQTNTVIPDVKPIEVANNENNISMQQPMPNPVLTQFSQPVLNNEVPVINNQTNTQNSANIQQPVQNPALAQFSQPVLNNEVPVINNINNSQNNTGIQQPVQNPVMQEFNSSMQNNNTGLQTNNINSNNQTDIFGQPINKS